MLNLEVEEMPDDRAQTIAHVISRVYDSLHVPIGRALPRLTQQAHELARQYGDEDPRLHDVARELDNLAAHLQAHMREEAHRIFPSILSGRGAEISGVLDALEVDNEEARDAVARLARLTDHFSARVDLPPAWTAFVTELADFDHLVRELARWENGVLYPRATCGEAPYG